MEKLLLEDPDFFRGQIIFQKDGFNMARRSPIADGLDKQLQLLTDHGYQVVTVSELLERSPFQDVLPDSETGQAARLLLGRGWCAAYQDNTIRPDAVLTRGELAMMSFGWETVRQRIALVRSGRAPFRDLEPRHPYAAAAARAAEMGAIAAVNGRFRPNDPVTSGELAQFCSARLGKTLDPVNRNAFTHEEFFRTVVGLLDQ